MLDNLTKANACGAAITPSIVMVALVGAIRDHEIPAYVRMHEAQRVSWHNCAILANDVEFNPDEMPNYPFIKETVGGISIKVDNKLYPSTIVFHNAEGKPVARIQRLAIPCGFEDQFPSLLNCPTNEAYEERLEREGWLFV